MNVWLSPNSLILVKESHQKWVRFPLCSHVHVRQNFLEHLWNSFERLWTFFVLLSDPYKKSWHSQDQNVMLINLKKLLDSINGIHWSHSIPFISQLVTQDDRNLAPQSFEVCLLCWGTPWQAEILFHPGQKQKYSTFIWRWFYCHIFVAFNRSYSDSDKS